MIFPYIKIEISSELITLNINVFSVSLKLIDQWGNLTINKNRIKVEMQMFTKEYKPRKLLLNNVGDKIIRRNH